MILRVTHVERLNPPEWEVHLKPQEGEDLKFAMTKLILVMNDDPLVSIGDFYRIEPVQPMEIAQMKVALA